LKFPSCDQIIRLRLYSSTKENHNKDLKLLKKFSPVYYIVYRRKGLQESTKLKSFYQ
ncbi:3529_t:CDS:1, partial [Gigaspora rosea]